jgi:hypothetical protein
MGRISKADRKREHDRASELWRKYKHLIADLDPNELDDLAYTCAYWLG